MYLTHSKLVNGSATVSWYMALQRCKILVKLQSLIWTIFGMFAQVWSKMSLFLRFIFAILAFIVIGQLSIDRKWEKEGDGDGIGKGPGHELGTPKAQLRYMSAHCPRGYWRRQKCLFLMSWSCNFTLLSNQQRFILSLVKSAFTQRTCFWNSTKEHKNASLAHLKMNSTQHKSQHHFNLIQETQQNLAAL